VPPQRLRAPGYPDIVRSDEDRDRFDRLYDDLVRVTGLDPGEALLNAATQFQLGFDVRAPFEKRKRRKKVYASGGQDGQVEAAEPEPPPSLEPPG
jgi:hypothetical protein